MYPQRRIGDIGIQEEEYKERNLLKKVTTRLIDNTPENIKCSLKKATRWKHTVCENEIINS